MVYTVRLLPPPKRHKSHETGELLVNQKTIPNSYQHEGGEGGKRVKRQGEQRAATSGGLIKCISRDGYDTARSGFLARAGERPSPYAPLNLIHG